MVTMFFNQPLGMGVGDGMQMTDATIARQPKMWIPVVLAAASLATTLYSANKASKEAKKAERRQREQEAKEDAWYNRRYNEDYLDTAAGQNLVRRAKEFAKENWKRAVGAQAVIGGTDASVQMAKDAGNKMVGDTIANIAAADTQRKAQVDDMHRNAQSQFAQMDMSRYAQNAQNITNAGQQASNALMSAAGALGQTSANKPNLKGGSNNSTPAPTTDPIKQGSDAPTKTVNPYAPPVMENYYG